MPDRAGWRCKKLKWGIVGCSSAQRRDGRIGRSRLGYGDEGISRREHSADGRGSAGAVVNERHIHGDRVTHLHSGEVVTDKFHHRLVRQRSQLHVDDDNRTVRNGDVLFYLRIITGSGKLQIVNARRNHAVVIADIGVGIDFRAVGVMVEHRNRRRHRQAGDRVGDNAADTIESVFQIVEKGDAVVVPEIRQFAGGGKLGCRKLNSDFPTTVVVVHKVLSSARDRVPVPPVGNAVIQIGHVSGGAVHVSGVGILTADGLEPPVIGMAP